MAVSKAQLCTLKLLHMGAARRVYRSWRAGDYTWIHEQTDGSITPTLHRLLTSGHAAISPDDDDMAVITEKGRAVVALTR